MKIILKKSPKKFLTLTRGDVIETTANNSKIYKKINYVPKVNIKEEFLNLYHGIMSILKLNKLLSLNKAKTLQYLYDQKLVNSIICDSIVLMLKDGRPIKK